jgi:U4/U6.U5 tri-snRNP-associated protein 2
MNILAKFDGTTITDDIRAGRRRFRLTRLPRFLNLHVRRFTKNNFFIEKNPTLVTFPVKNLELKDMVAVPKGKTPQALGVRVEGLI